MQLQKQKQQQELLEQQQKEKDQIKEQKRQERLRYFQKQKDIELEKQRKIDQIEKNKHNIQKSKQFRDMWVQKQWFIAFRKLKYVQEIRNGKIDQYYLDQLAKRMFNVLIIQLKKMLDLKDQKLQKQERRAKKYWELKVIRKSFDQIRLNIECNKVFDRHYLMQLKKIYFYMLLEQVQIQKEDQELFEDQFECTIDRFQYMQLAQKAIKSWKQYTKENKIESYKQKVKQQLMQKMKQIYK